MILLYFAILSTLVERAFESVRNFPLLPHFVIETFIGKLHYLTNKLVKHSFVIREYFDMLKKTQKKMKLKKRLKSMFNFCGVPKTVIQVKKFK